ncbi:HAMP domain-containing sensor histidine kinase [uncultured Cohaesibacter sp.]|uniref:sensor histidine kinase n=1 Tax=uncultured Cohaesibacter sp. TaxID=1002546 RepID=UPI0029317984|nr:HAMP domain-containing sensor histidine kinase [uncultured Cohaesibacter sp.]
MMFTRLNFSSMRTQIFLLAVIPIALLGFFASIHGTLREARHEQQEALLSQAAKILLIASQCANYCSEGQPKLIEDAASRLGLSVRVTDDLSSNDIDLRFPSHVNNDDFNNFIEQISRKISSKDTDIIKIRISDSNSIVLYNKLIQNEYQVGSFLPVMILTCLVILPILLLSYYLSYIFTAPISKFAEEAQRISALEDTQELFETRGALEFCSLRDSLNTMQMRVRGMAEKRTMMLRSLGHDLRTPLTRLRMRAERSLDPDLRQLLLRDISTLTSMIDETMLYLKSVEPDSPDLLKKVDLSSLLRTITSDFTDTGVSVSFSGPVRLVCKCQPRNITRAVANLIDNAARYSDKIELVLALSGQGVISIQVRDFGPGLDDALKTHVVEPFFKADPSRRADKGGLGLGLSIVRGIAQAHGGHLTIRDNLPHGLIVEVAFPSQGSDPQS